ncbi:hypothetical protein [Oceanobacillus neutriphilus]|uniref:hypothetical protein n=1 Tax=Oceanobacillus neutriphilus TaxID=531815 RepID=UPI001E2EA99D|nr:hypothetical protein [Oceanobacillus neutriphilus]
MDRFAFLGACSSANFCQEEHLAKLDLQMMLFPIFTIHAVSSFKLPNQPFETLNDLLHQVISDYFIQPHLDIIPFIRCRMVRYRYLFSGAKVE